MEIKVLEKLGLSKGEVKVYSALLTLGECTITPLTTESGVTKSKIYDILEKLIKKGLVGYNVKKNVKHFFVNDPRKILDYLSQKEDEIKSNKEEIEKIMPSLIEQRNMSSVGRVAEIYQGYNGMKTIREELMESYSKGETFLVLGAPKIANDKWEGWLLEFHKKRIKRGVGMKIIYNSDARVYGDVRNKMKNTEARYFAEGINAPNWIDIFPSAVMITVIVGEPISFVIRNKEIATSFRAYFEIMWNSAKTE
jgi:sugar-specific transcriptional regulator TrmB